MGRQMWGWDDEVIVGVTSMGREGNLLMGENAGLSALN